MKTLSISILFAAAMSMALQESRPQDGQLTVENDPECHFEGTISFSKLRAYVRDPRFIECSRRQDAEESAEEVKPEPEIARIRPSPQPWDLDDPVEEKAQGNSVQRLEDLKQNISHYGSELASCYNQNGEFNTEQYLKVRQKIFDVKKQIQDFDSTSDEKASVEKALQKLLVWVKMVDSTAEEATKTRPVTTAI